MFFDRCEQGTATKVLGQKSDLEQLVVVAQTFDRIAVDAPQRIAYKPIGQSGTFEREGHEVGHKQFITVCQANFRLPKGGCDSFWFFNHRSRFAQNFAHPVDKAVAVGISFRLKTAVSDAGSEWA